MVRVVLFDFDGTIADTLQLAVNSFNENAQKLGYRGITDVEKLRAKSGREVIQKEMGIPFWKLPYLAFKAKKILKDKMGEAKLFRGMSELINELRKNYIVGILTSNTKGFVEDFLERENLNVDFLVAGSGIYNKQWSFKKLLITRKWKKEDVIYVGDQILDVEACKKAGIKIIAVSWGYNTSESLRNVGADYLVEKPEEILGIIKQT